FAHLLLLLPPPPPLTPSPSPYPTLFRSHITYVFTPQAHESRGYHLPLYQNNQGYHFRNRSWGTRFDQTVADVRVTVYRGLPIVEDRKSTRLNSSHVSISYAVFCLNKKIA